MIPILFESTERDFLSNGICRLVDCLSCFVTEERNGIYECEFTYSVTGKNYEQIRIGRVIYATHDDTQTPQPFDIYKRTANIEGVVTFYARHIAYRLANVILQPFQAGSCAVAVAGLKTNSINTNLFNFWTDKDVTAPFQLLAPRSVWSTLGGQEGSILDVYGKGTYEFDKWTVRLYLNRGQKADVQIRYGKNLTEFELEQEAAGANAYVPYWLSSEGDSVVTVPGWVVIAPGQGGAEMLSDEQGEVIADENGVPIEVSAGRGVVPEIIDLSDAFEEAPTPEQLQVEALRRLNESQPWTPGENLQINFAALWQTPEYESVAPLQRVRLCDSVSVYFPALDYTAKDVQIIKTTYNTLLDRYDAMEMGQPTVTLASLIQKSVERTVLRQVPSTSAMAQAIDAATKLITGGTGGHVVLATDADGKPNEILIMDTEDIATAVKVLRINQNGIGFSQTGYNGPFTTAWTLDGHFVADFITTGTLDGALLKADSVKARAIDVENLFAQDITATGKISGAELEAGDPSSDYYFHVFNDGSVFLNAISFPCGGNTFWFDQYDNSQSIIGTRNLRLWERNKASDTTKQLFEICTKYNSSGEITRYDFDIMDAEITKHGFPLIVAQVRSTTAAIPGNSAASGSFNVSINYKPIGVLGFAFTDTNSSFVSMNRCYIDGSTCHWSARCTHVDGYNGNLDVYVLLMAK